MRDIPNKSNDEFYIPAEFNSFKNASQNTIISSDQTLSEADAFQLAKALSNYAGIGNFYVQTGSPNTYTLSAISPFKAPSKIFDGLTVRTRIVDTNTGASTLDWNGTGAKAIKKNRGVDDLVAGDLVTDDYPIFVYELSSNIWNLITEPIESSYPLGYLSGFKIEQDSGDTAHDIKIYEGAARGQKDLVDLKIPVGSTIIKQIDVDWVEGTNQGGFPSGLTLTADTWYHVFVITKPNGFTDAGVDSATDATNLLADATDYIDYKRTGSILVDGSSNIIDFVQTLTIGQRLTYWKVDQQISNSNPGISAVTRAISTPLGIQVLAHLAVYLDSDDSSANINGRIYAVDEPVGTDFNHNIQAGYIATTDVAGSSDIMVKTDLLSQIKYIITATSAGTRMQIETRGWIE